MRFRACLAVLFSLLAGLIITAASQSEQVAEFDGKPWHLKGDGMVCCPCREPCPCRSNSTPSFGHCEATLYLHVLSGHYGDQDLSGLKVVETSGSCAMSYRKVASIYFDQGTSAQQKAAFMKLVASFFPEKIAAFSQVNTNAILTKSSPDGQIKVQIPGILEMEVERNWGKTRRALPFVAASDYYSNQLQYANNIRYKMTDRDSGLVFDYSHRQANYREIDLDYEQYRAKSMLIQFVDGKGWFNEKQLQIIGQQNLSLPDLGALRRDIQALKASSDRP